MHHRRDLKGLPADSPERASKFNPLACSVEGCRRKHYSKGFCALHYNRMLRSGDVGPVGPIYKKPTFRLEKNGYVTMRGGDGRRVAQHRAIMENMLGRPLHPWETVHHKNRVRDDNREENLELWLKGQPSGARMEDIVEWIVEFYPEFVIAAMAERQPLRLVPPLEDEAES